MLCRAPIAGVISVDIGQDGKYLAFLARTPTQAVGVVNCTCELVASHALDGADPTASYWLDATADMENVAVTVEPCPPGPGGTHTGVESYTFDGTTLTRDWGTPLISRYETVEVRVSEDKRYVAAATSSGPDIVVLDKSAGRELWRYDAGAEQFAVDGDANLNYVIGGTITSPYRYFILKNNGPLGFQLLATDQMSGKVDDLDATPDGAYFAFGSDAGEYILFRRAGDRVEAILKGGLGRRIDAVEVGTSSLLLGGEGFIDLYSFEGSTILRLSLGSTASVADYEDGVYVVGTSSGELYLLDEAGQYGVVDLQARPVRDVRIEKGFVGVAAGDDVIKAKIEEKIPLTAQLEVAKEGSLEADNDGNGLPSLGDTVKYTVTVTNIGGAAATGVAFTDTLDGGTGLLCDGLSAPTATLASKMDCTSGPGGALLVSEVALGPGASLTITFHATITSTGPRQVCNQGKVSWEGQSADTNRVCIEVSASPKSEPQPGIDVEKKVSTSAGGPWLDSVTVTRGTTVWYQIKVTNTGEAALSNVTLTDSLYASSITSSNCGGSLPTTLEQRASFTCTFSVAATSSSVNEATASGKYGAAAVSDTAQATVTVTTPAGPPSPPAEGGTVAAPDLSESGLIALLALMVLLFGGMMARQGRLVSKGE
jgi:uncharacterized repeat protein (TIGR01451 family)